MDSSVETRSIATQGADQPWHTMSADDVLAIQQVERESGLSSSEATARSERFGPNRFAAAATEPRWRAFLRQYADPMQIVLLVAGAVSLYPLKELETGIVLIALTLFNAVLGLRQEGRAAAAVAALQRMMIVTARVTRDGELRQVPAEQLVPGDIVSVEAGDIVPADGRLLRVATLEIAESALTGESLPVGKALGSASTADTPLGDRTCMVYLNTNVTRGSGEFVVTAIGMETEVGRISGLLAAQDDTPSPLTRQLSKLTRQILVIAGAALVVSMGLNLARGAEFTVVFAAAVAFAIGALPENLPAVVTTILASGTQALAKAGAIMKRMQSTETLGSTSAINSDKTGTLTLNEMTAVQLTVVGRRFAIDGAGYTTTGQINRVAGQPVIDLDEFMLPMVLASDAVVSDGNLIGDPTEGALVALAAKGGIDAVTTRQAYPRLAEVPFDADYKLMATFHRMADPDGREVVRCYVKGAPDQLLARAATVHEADRGPLSATDEVRERYLAENRRLGEQGLRVIATARKDLDPSTFDPQADLLPLVNDLQLLALVGIVDPPRPTAKASIATARAAGIKVRMITGDHAVTAAAIAEQLGIDGRVISGAEFAELTDDEARQMIDEVGVIARVTPQDKVRLVELLQDDGQIVAMTGDGVNDAPALKKADIGIAMGVTGTEVTKEAAVMILTDDNFSTIVKAVELGRGLYDNLTRYIRFQMGCLFGFIVTFLGSSIFSILAGVPFLPLQTLWINFTTLLFQAVGLGYGQPSEGLMERRPRPPGEPILNRALFIWLISTGIIMGIGTLGVISFSEVAYGEAVAHTMGVVTFSLFALLFSIATKDQQRTAFSVDTVSDATFTKATGLSILTLVVATVFGPLQGVLDTVGLTAGQWLTCLAVSASILIVSEIVKAIGRRSHRDHALEPAMSALTR
ncbi:cation-translocating P-type ATPase [Microlunatus ginsengisoli]|uniref:Cation-transporting P-type ATPase n=1 Tax=Microlunatus ginsengisoli TaxID=363863 RepID=A0ABP7AIQ6_9ACTN